MGGVALGLPQELDLGSGSTVGGALVLPRSWLIIQSFQLTGWSVGFDSSLAWLGLIWFWPGFGFGFRLVCRPFGACIVIPLLFSRANCNTMLHGVERCGVEWSRSGGPERQTNCFCKKHLKRATFSIYLFSDVARRPSSFANICRQCPPPTRVFHYMDADLS